MFKVGTVTHYYDKIGIAIINLDNLVAVGDKIKFVENGIDLFGQTIDSLQIEHKKVESAGRGDVVGLKTNEAVREGTQVFKTS